MKILLDQGLPRSAADALREVGVDAVHVGDIGMAAALDEQILARAHAEERVVVTLDADFHASGGRAPDPRRAGRLRGGPRGWRGGQRRHDPGQAEAPTDWTLTGAELTRRLLAPSAREPPPDHSQ